MNTFLHNTLLLVMASMTAPVACHSFCPMNSQQGRFFEALEKRNCSLLEDESFRTRCTETLKHLTIINVDHVIAQCSLSTSQDQVCTACKDTIEDFVQAQQLPKRSIDRVSASQRLARCVSSFIKNKE